MSWDARQRAMLAEMGYRLPPAAVAAAALAAEADAATVPDAPPVASPAPPAARAAQSTVTAPTPAMPPRAVAPMQAPSVAPVHAPVRPVLTGQPDFAAMDWPGLRDAVSACRACGLCEHRRLPVFGSGAVEAASWLVVTDPPDDADDAAGEPFVAEAGRLLDRMLLAAGHRRVPGAKGEAPTAFVTPVVKCRPPRGRAPQAEELAACHAVLARQAAMLQPRVVLALGLQAARRLTGLTEPLGRLRGQVHRWQGLPVVVSFHPAYLLRSPADKAGAWDDLRLAMRTAGTL